jgi:hypothetical protein
MAEFLNDIIWQQFGAAIDTLDDALRACPDHIWEATLWENPAEPPSYAQFWLLGYHTLFWIDLYLSGSREGFAPPAFLQREERDEEGVPAVPYSKDELLAYLQYCRAKCQETLAALTPDGARRLCRFPWGEVSFAELQLYNMRHVQEHAAQLSLLLGQRLGPEATPGWVAAARR